MDGNRVNQELRFVEALKLGILCNREGVYWPNLSFRAKGRLKTKISVKGCTVFLAGTTLPTASEEKVKRHAVREHSGGEIHDGLFRWRS
jgi:hypothetical protein